jgi:transporter family-2 protein
MNALLLPGLVALLAGVAIGIQNPITSLIGQRVGLLGGAFAVHFGGTLVAGVLLAATRGTTLAAWRGIPGRMVLAGGLGVVVLTCVSYAIPRIGLAATVGLLLTAQLGISTWVDHYGLLGVSVRTLDLGRLAGLGLLMLGAWLVLRR